MSQRPVTFRKATQMARTVVGPVPRARLWNMLSTRAREGQDITDFTTLALVASVVGSKAEAEQFVASVQAVWCRPRSL